MILKRANPTIRETNRYLDRTVTTLTHKFGGDSNEEFERALVKETGIGWKQVKNYKNHPNPKERLKDNSLIIRYVREQQAHDTVRRVIRTAVPLLCFAAAAFTVYRILIAPRAIELYAVHEIASGGPVIVKLSTVFIQIPRQDWILRNGPIKNANLPWTKIDCIPLTGTTIEHCEYQAEDENKFRMSITRDGQMIRSFTIFATDQGDIQKILRQLESVIGVSFSKAHIGKVNTQQFKVGQETVNIVQTDQEPGTIPSIGVTVTL